ncbi:MAG: hypothetical protein ACOCRK_07350 [bacterium]
MNKFDYNDEIVISENLKKINVLEDFFKLNKMCRENYYYLRSLINLFKNRISLAQIEFDREMIITKNKIKKDINKVKNSFKNIEEIISSQPTIEDEIKDFTPRKFIEVKEIIEICKSSLTVNAKISKLQINILDFLIKNEKLLMEKIVDENPKLSEMHMQIETSFLINIAFDHSSEEDRIITYRLECTSEKFAKDLNEAGFDLPIIVKIRDYSFTVNKKRKLFREFHKDFIKMIAEIPKIEEQKYIIKLTEEQKQYNKQVTILTYIIVVLTLLMAYLTYLNLS